MLEDKLIKQVIANERTPLGDRGRVGVGEVSTKALAFLVIQPIFIECLLVRDTAQG